ncbi:MAG: hypothetical protein ABJ360_20300 [Roseobacter sp.]
MTQLENEEVDGMDLDVPQPHSIWLVPKGATFATLKKCIVDLADHTGNGPFDPHMTLLGDLQGSPTKTIQRCTDILSGSGAISTRVTGLSRGDAFFKSLFLDLIVPEELLVARTKLCAVLEGSGGGGFQPHISLAYNETSDEYDPEILSVLGQNFADTTVIMTGVAVVSSAQNIPIARWRCLDHLSL